MKINLLRQKSTKFKRAEMIRRVNLTVVWVSVSAFILMVLYISTYYVYLRLRLGELSRQLTALEQTYASRASEVVDYLRVKQVMANVNAIQAQRFRYKDFLLGIYRMLPESARLATVDFSEGGVISFSTRLTNLTDYETLLARVKSESGGSEFLFAQVAQKSLTREKTGQFIVSMEARIK